MPAQVTSGRATLSDGMLVVPSSFQAYFFGMTLDEAFCPTTHPPGVAGGQGGREAIGAGDHGRRWWGWWEGGREEGK